MAQSRETITLKSSKEASDTFLRRFLIVPFEYLNTVVAFVVLVMSLALAIPVGVIRTYHQPHPALIWDRIFRSLMRGYFFSAGIKLVFEHVDRLPVDTPYVLASNHASHLDGMLLDVLTGDQPSTGIVAPYRYFPWPFSFWLRVIGSIEVARTERERERYSDVLHGEVAVDQAVSEIVKHHHIVMIAPEGHIERHHELLPFKTGAVRIALKAQVPLVPVTIRGTTQVFSLNKLILRPGTIRVIVHEPLVFDLPPGAEKNELQTEALTYRLLRAIARDLPADYHTPAMHEAVLAAGQDNPVTK